MPEIPQQRAEAPLILSLDIGTSSARAAVYDRLGNYLQADDCRREYRLRTDRDGAAELDAGELFESVCQIVDAALAANGAAIKRHGIGGVACCTFWHSMVGVGDEGRAVTPILTWADTRSTAAAERLKQRLDERAVHSRTGAVFHSSYFPARLVWLEETQPDLLRRVARWMSPGEYIHQRLFGRSLCSISMASGTGLLNQHQRTWDAELLLALPLRPDQLSPLVELDTRLSGLCPPFASRWPALRDVPWFPAAGDGACSNIGSGCTNPERIALMVGTSGAMRVVCETSRFEIPAGLWCYRVDGARIVLGGALTGGGDLYAWLRELLNLKPRDPDQLEADLAAQDADAHGLTVLPFPAGERSPGWAGHARAAFSGLSFETQPIDVLRAGMEAVAYRFALIAREMRELPPAREVIASGGALTASPAWTQIMADVLGRSVTLSAEPEASSRGAALLALESLGALSRVEDAPAAMGRVFAPDPRRTARYAEAIERQECLYELLIRRTGIA